jgi:hypothetical protein
MTLFVNRPSGTDLSQTMHSVPEIECVRSAPIGESGARELQLLRRLLRDSHSVSGVVFVNGYRHEICQWVVLLFRIARKGRR